MPTGPMHAWSRDPGGPSDTGAATGMPKTRKRRIETEAGGDDTKKAKLLIKAAIKQAGGKPAFAQALADEVRQRGVGAVPAQK